MRRVFKTAINAARNIILWGSVLIALAWTAVFFVPKLFGYYPYVVLSGSMEPVVHTGSLAYVELFDDTREFESGDILAYRTIDGEMVLHRLMGMSDTGYVFKGDANDAYDMNTVEEENIIGRYSSSFPNMGYAAVWVSNKSIMIGQLKVPAVILIMTGLILITNVAAGLTDTDDTGSEAKDTTDLSGFVRISNKNKQI